MKIILTQNQHQLLTAMLTLLLSAATAVGQSEIEAEVKKLSTEIAQPSEIRVLPARTATQPKAGALMLHLRNTSSPATSEDLRTFEEGVIAGLNGGAFKVSTLRDMTGSIGNTSGGRLAESVTDASVSSVALANGYENVLFADIHSLQMREVQVAGKSIQNIELRGGLVLHSAAEGSRQESVTDVIIVRGFEPQALTSRAFTDLAARLTTKASKWKALSSNIKPATMEVHVKVDGLVLPYLPGPDGLAQAQQLDLYADGVAVELDSIALGNAPCRVDVWPGLHRLKVSRDGIGGKEITVNVNGPGRYDLTLTPTDEIRRKFNEQLMFMEKVRQQQREGRAKEEILKSQAELLRGLAAMFRQSGLRIDHRKIKDPDHLSTAPAAPEPKRP
jgi:hypothetical protein